MYCCYENQTGVTQIDIDKLKSILDLDCKCANFPPSSGIIWTYSGINFGEISYVTEEVNELVNGHIVYRYRQTDWPLKCGDLIGCDTTYGEINIGFDSFIIGPNGPEKTGERQLWEEPYAPRWGISYGSEVGAVENRFYDGSDGFLCEVLSYETLTIPFGSFENVMKIKLTFYDDGELDRNAKPIYRWIDNDIGLLREEEIDNNPYIMELINYKLP